jgi:succinate dehydrogenase / fumarate reductase flavoprotein subunit
VGSGAAAFNAADRLFQFGQQDIALVTEGVNAGTSRNTGSDKQTYFKLTLSGTEEDSVRSAAETLKSGGCTDGDTALCEASLSARCFLRLLELGVPFPETVTEKQSATAPIMTGNSARPVPVPLRAAL